MLIELIKHHAKTIEKEIIEIRNHLHMYPELGGEEFKTQQLIINYLKAIGVDEVHKSAETGVVGIIYGSGPGKSVGIRADIDALPIIELNEVDYKSRHDGKMHACGHDAHTAILLGTAKIITELKKHFKGSVKLFFQPAEETFGGAKRMIDEGWLENPYVDYVLGLHVDSGLEAGHVRYKYGVMQAMSSGLRIEIKGKGCHAAHPEEGIDAILVAGKVIDALQSVISRNTSAFDPAVVTIGKISGGTVANAVAEDVLMQGTIRTLSEEVTSEIALRITELTTKIASAYGARAKVTINPGYIPLYNNDKVVNTFCTLAKKVLGSTKVHDKEFPSLGVEDFAYFAKARPSCFYNLGVASIAKKITAPGHSGNFDIDLNSLYYGMIMHTITALELLNK